MRNLRHENVKSDVTSEKQGSKQRRAEHSRAVRSRQEKREPQREREREREKERKERNRLSSVR